MVRTISTDLYISIVISNIGIRVLVPKFTICEPSNRHIKCREVYVYR